MSTIKFIIDLISKGENKTPFITGSKTKNPRHIFHGGCHGCTMQRKKGLKYCRGCRYFEQNWNLPNLKG